MGAASLRALHRHHLMIPTIFPQDLHSRVHARPIFFACDFA